MANYKKTTKVKKAPKYPPLPATIKLQPTNHRLAVSSSFYCADKGCVEVKFSNESTMASVRVSLTASEVQALIDNLTAIKASIRPRA